MSSNDSFTNPPKALFQPFSWHADFDHTPGEHLAEAAQDIGNGIRVALQLIEASELAEDAADAPILNLTHRSHLMRLAIRAADLLADSAERSIELANERKINARSARGEA